jgi:hypothetical protein
MLKVLLVLWTVLTVATVELSAQESREWTDIEILNLAQMATDHELCKELEIVDSQRTRLLKIRKEFLEQHQKIWRDYSQNGDQMTGEERKRLNKELLNKSVSELKDAFVPHQLELLRQIVRQERYNATSFDFGLLNETVIKELEIDTDQKNQIQELATEHREEVKVRLEKLTKSLQKIRAKAYEDMLAELTDEQRKIYVELFGDIQFRKLDVDR